MTNAREQRQQIPNMQIRDCADSFKAAWDLLEKQPPGHGFVLPQINVGAIAIELYLKCLSATVVHTQRGQADEPYFVTAEPQVPTHRLTKIFDNIAPYIQRGVDLAFSSRDTAPGRTFRDVIDALEGAFLESRYPFERGRNISKYRLRDFELVVQCLHDFISTMTVEEWIQSIDQNVERTL